MPAILGRKICRQFQLENKCRCFFFFFFFFLGGGGGGGGKKLPGNRRTIRSAKVKFKVCIPGKSMGRAQNSTREGTQYPNPPGPSGGGGGSHPTSLI